MKRLQFNGPEGTAWPGRRLRAVAPQQTKLSVLQRLCEETGLRVPEIIEHAEQDAKDGDGLWAMGVAVHLAVNNAGFQMSLAEVLDTFSMSDVESVDDEPAPASDDGSTAPDPTSAPTASGQGDVEGVASAPVSRAKPRKTSTKR